MKRLAIILFVFLFIATGQAFAAKHKKKKHNDDKDTLKTNVGFYVGINLGAYFGNAHTANFYNGAPGNDNNLNYIFGNKYYIQQIIDTLRVDTIQFTDYPHSMHYKAAIAIGGYIKYNFINNFGVFLQFNYSKLTAQDAFSLTIAPRLYPTFQDIRLYPIWGKEVRSNIDLGVSKMFVFGKRVGLSVDFGINMNNTIVKENKIRIDNPETNQAVELNLVNVYGGNWVPNSGQTGYNVRQGGIGYGLLLGANLQLIFNDYISIDPGVTVYYKKINFPGYDTFRFHYMAFVRLTFKNIGDLF